MSNLIPRVPAEEIPANSNGMGRTLATNERPSPPSFGEEAPYQYDGEEEQWDFKKLLALFNRRRPIIIGVFTTIVALTILMSILTPRVYRSTAQVIINSNKNNTNSFAANIPALGDLLEGAGGRTQDTEIQILQSRPVQQAALQLLPTSLRGSKIVRLEVQPVGSTDLVNVSTNSTNSQFAEQFTNKLCTAYVQQTQEESNRQYAGTANYVNGQLKSLKVKMDKSSDELRRYKERNGITDLSAETAARLERLKDLQQAVEQARVERAAGVAQLGRLVSSAQGTPRAEIAPSNISVRPIVQQLEQKLTTLQTQRNEALGEFTPGSPEVRGIEEQIALTRSQLGHEPRTEVQNFSRTLSPVRQSLDQQIAQTRALISANESRVATLDRQVFEARRDLATMPEREFHLSQLQMELQTYQQAYQTLNDKYLQLRISQAAPVANARVLSPALGAVKVKPNIPMNIIMGVFLASLLSLTGALVVDRMDNRIHSDDDVRAATHLPILAYIPKVLHFETESLVALATSHNDNQHTPLLESYRMLRTSLMFTVLDSPLRCIMLTSSQPNEGKSSIAANLAAVLAMNGKTVILIDADLRRPSAHRLFGLSGEKGFSTVAAGLCTLEEAIQNTEIEGLRVLPVGPTPPNPPEMLDSRSSRQILQRARELADFVIIDAPPALMMADAQIIATEADGILLVVSWEEALKDAVARTSDLLARTGVKLLGVVINKWDDRQAAYQSYYQKHYYALSPEAEAVKSEATKSETASK